MPGQLRERRPGQDHRPVHHVVGQPRLRGQRDPPGDHRALPSGSSTIAQAADARPPHPAPRWSGHGHPLREPASTAAAGRRTQAAPPAAPGPDSAGQSTGIPAAQAAAAACAATGSARRHHGAASRSPHPAARHPPAPPHRHGQHRMRGRLDEHAVPVRGQRPDHLIEPHLPAQAVHTSTRASSTVPSSQPARPAREQNGTDPDRGTIPASAAARSPRARSTCAECDA